MRSAPALKRIPCCSTPRRYFCEMRTFAIQRQIGRVSQFEIWVSTQSGPDESAQSAGRVARLSRNVRQPNHVLANSIAGHKAERRPGAGEEWLAAAKHNGAEVESIFINKTKV